MSVIIKDMDMPIDCLGCRIILCERESYKVPGRPVECPLEEYSPGDWKRNVLMYLADLQLSCNPRTETGRAKHDALEMAFRGISDMEVGD